MKKIFKIIVIIISICFLAIKRKINIIYGKTFNM